MTASTAFREDVIAGVNRQSRRHVLDFLENFAKSGDKAGVNHAASVSTKKFYDTRTLAASATENLDMSGALLDENGAAVNFTKVHGIYLRASSANVNGVVIGGASSNAFVGPFADATDKVTVGPGDTFLVTSVAGWTVTAATADLLKLANSSSGTGVTFDILIVGV